MFDNQTVARRNDALQVRPELNPSAKRLLLSAHLKLISKKLRRGACVEEGELLSLLPFTVPNGWQSDSTAPKELSPSGAEWMQHVVEASALP